MTPEGILRLFSFEPLAPAPVLDGRLRDRIEPTYRTTPGLETVIVGRLGTDGRPERLLATIWAASTAMDETPDEARLIAELDPVEAGHARPEHLDVVSIAAAIRTGRPTPPSIARLFRGEVRPGSLDDYVGVVSRGASVDAQTNEGLISLFVGIEPPVGFVTLSLWTDWPSIERATGGNIRSPLSTKHPELIVAGHPAHYELLGPAGPRATAGAGATRNEPR